MSTFAISWAWNQPIKSKTDKLILLKLADQANDDGVCWPSVRTLAKHVGTSKSSVSRAVNALCAAGLLAIRETTKDDGSKGPNVYTLNLAGGVPGVGHLSQPGGTGGVSHLGGTESKTSTRSKPVNPLNLASAPPTPVEPGRWSVPTSYPPAGKGPYVVTIDPDFALTDKGELNEMGPGIECTCENTKFPVPCRHARAAAKAEWKVRTAELKLLRDAVWDALVEAYGEPPSRQKTAFGAARSDIVEQLERDPKVPRTAEAWGAEVRRRRSALAADWGLGKATLQAFRTNWSVAGQLADGTGHPDTQGTVFDDYK